MGARICCLRPPSQSPNHAPNRSSSAVNHAGSVSSIIDLSESPCLKKGEEEKVTSPKSLGYRLVNSPGWKENDVGMIKQVSPQKKKKIYLSSSVALSPELPNEFYTPRNSLSTPRNGFAPRGLWKIEEEEVEEDGKNNSMDGRNVGRKRVKFILPGEADIILVYSSPDKSFDE